MYVVATVNQSTGNLRLAVERAYTERSEAFEVLAQVERANPYARYQVYSLTETNGPVGS